MTAKRFFNLIFVSLNFLALLFLVEKVQNPKDIRTNLAPVVKNSSVLPASDVKDKNLVRVTKVIDGDTIEIEGGKKVRYIGVDTPEVSFGKECYADEAKKRNEELVLGKNIELEKDLSETDKYGRLLRYVYVGEDENRVMVNEELVKNGFAQVSTYPPDVKYKDKFLELQKGARELKTGLWERCNIE